MSDLTEKTSSIPGFFDAKQLRLRRLGVRVVDGVDAGLSATFDHDIVRIGTQPGNHLRLTDTAVSRRHAEIVRTPQGLVLRDLESTNGTRIGETRISEAYLSTESVFTLGRTTIAFRVLDEVIDVTPSEQTTFGQMVGSSDAMRELFSILERVAETDLTVLITGETGTGKELVSRALHERSPRAERPFVVFDCGAVAENLIESELFGHKKGAFTGAVADRPGIFEQASGGTVFLDELGELPLSLQSTLLRVLEQREVRRVGGRTSRAVDVRVVAATNRDLKERVKEGAFRQDLYYRLAVVEVAVPPLRDRMQDLPLLIEHMLKTAPTPHSLKGVAPDVMEWFQQYRWPGNVRELRNVLFRAIPFCDGPLIDMTSLPEAVQTEPLTDATSTPLEAMRRGEDVPMREAKSELLEAFEREYIRELLERCGGNVSLASRRASVDRKTMQRLAKKYDLA